MSDLYPADAVTERNCAQWFAKFRAGDRSHQDLPRSGRPQILDCQSLKAAVDADSSVTSRELAIEFGSCLKTIINGLHEIGKVCKRGRWIPFKLTKNHKVQRITPVSQCSPWPRKLTFST
jgi:[histone H3]-lysine36 N-dimethyltransferase SETMAR